MAAVKEREVIVVATRPQDRSDSRWGGGGDSVPPGGSSDGGDGPGGGPSTLLVLLTILFCLAGATAVIAAFSNSIIEAANIYITNISDEMDAGVLSSSIVVMFWLIIPISIVCLLFLNNHALNFCRIEIRARVRHKVVRNYIIGCLILSLLFHVATITLMLTFIRIIQLAFLTITIGHLAEQFRLRYYPQDRYDVEAYFSEYGG
jgi:hypothetical protein